MSQQLFDYSSWTNTPTGSGSTYVSYKGCSHSAKEPVMIGGFPVWLAAHAALEWDVTKEMDLILPLNGTAPKAPFGSFLPILSVTLQDMGGVPENWPQFIEGMVEFIKSGKKVVAYCIGSHGRTGCFGASLIAMMEPDVEDPIAAIRERHCHHCVETERQAKAVFDIKGKPLPDKYKSVAKSFTYNTNNSWSPTPASQLYKITSITTKNGFIKYDVEKYGEYGSRIFFIGKEDSAYKVGQIVRLLD